LKVGMNARLLTPTSIIDLRYCQIWILRDDATLEQLLFWNVKLEKFADFDELTLTKKGRMTSGQ
jgi:hypothetical protein